MARGGSSINFVILQVMRFMGQHFFARKLRPTSVRHDRYCGIASSVPHSLSLYMQREPNPAARDRSICAQRRRLRMQRPMLYLIRGTSASLGSVRQYCDSLDSTRPYLLLPYNSTAGGGRRGRGKTRVSKRPACLFALRTSALVPCPTQEEAVAMCSILGCSCTTRDDRKQRKQHTSCLRQPWALGATTVQYS